MGADNELTSILRDIVQFLECLRDVKLPVSLESIRDSLLTRSRDTLTMFVVERIERPASPEQYLNMNAAGSKGLMATLRKEAELQEYVGADEHQQLPKHQAQDYYETFQTVESANNTTLAIHGAADYLRDKEEEIENTLVNIYGRFSAAQTKGKCQMCGSLYRKEGKKLFVFEQYRGCWVGLVGSHLLIYGNDRDIRPCTILPIRGYMARAAPNAIPRDQRRSESTFEIFRPGSRTFQFVAKTPKDMEEWVKKICKLGGDERNEHKDVAKAMVNVTVTGGSENTKPNDPDESERKEERYQDVGSLLNTDKHSEEQPNVSIETNVEADNSLPNDDFLDTSSPFPSSTDALTVAPSLTPPPPAQLCPSSLSTRIPRKLPSLPASTVPRSSFEFPEEEEDDIYHKIDDFRDSMRYGNVGETFQAHQSNNDSPVQQLITYDDVRVGVKTETKIEEKRNEGDVEAAGMKSGSTRGEDTYDDAAAATVGQDNKITEHPDKFVSYDDVESVALNARSLNVRGPDKADESAKSPQKKSFLCRVRSRKESQSPRKVEKKVKYKSPPPATPTINNQKSATCYDGVTDLNVQTVQELHRFEEEQSEYTCPPPPRPIYLKPPSNADAIGSQEFYDDITACRDKFRSNGEIADLHQQTTKDSNRTEADRIVFCENEHYKTPRVDTRYPRCHYIDQEVEDLYDDIAILADFTARQKEILVRKDSEGGASRSQGSPEKKSWNRFVSGRKLKPADATVAETNGRRSNGMEESGDDFNEQHASMRMNTFQKLISRMENSLGKASSRSTSSIMLNKANVTNNA